MMILYYCNDPSVNIQNYTCNECSGNISEGKRWHCLVCPDYDLCEKCKKCRKHEHNLIPFDLKIQPKPVQCLQQVSVWSGVKHS